MQEKNMNLASYSPSRTQVLDLVVFLNNVDPLSYGLIVPSEFINIFGEYKENRVWSIIRTEEALDAENKRLPHFSHLIVMDIADELGLCLKLKRMWPNAKIISYHYDFVTMRQIGQSPFAELKKIPRKGQCRYLLLSLPGSEAEYLHSCMKVVGLPFAKEAIVPTHSLYAVQAKKISLSKLLYKSLRGLGVYGDYGLHLQADTLLPLIEQGKVTKDFIQKALDDADIKIIYFSRRDKLMQAGILGVLNNTRFRSIQDMQGNPKARDTIKRVEQEMPYNLLQILLEQEKAFEEWLAPFKGHMKMITLETLASNPRDVLEDLAQFLNLRLDKNAKVPSFGAIYRNVPELVEKARDFRRDVIDRLGLHVNASGSLVSPEDHLYKDTETN